MTHPHHHAPPPSIRPATLAWLWGGGAILVSGLMRVLQALPITAVIGSGPVTLLAAGAFALGLIVLALGIRKQGSIVGRHRAGMIALFVLAGLEVIQGIIIESFTAVPAGSRDAVAAFSDLLIVVALGASVVAAIVIVRAGAVRGILRWLPMIALVIAIALQLAIRIALSEAWNVPLTRGSFVVSAQVALALVDASLGIIAMPESLRAGGRPP